MKLFIYGAGREGIRALQDIGQNHVSGFVDQTKVGSLNGCRIYKLEDLASENKDDVFFLITPRKNKHEISEKLIDSGYCHFCLYSHIVSLNTTKALDADEWGSIYNEELLKNIIQDVNSGRRKSWSEEILKITKPNDKVLEIGCGSGSSTLHLAKNGRICTALDFSKSSIDLLNRAAGELNLRVETKLADARKKLPFLDNAFDVVFQAGLLEHFSQDERVEMLKLWKSVGRTMVSMIPNAGSIAYRAGKLLQEQNGDWEYGLEMPQHTMIKEFMEAGYHNVREYSIGIEDSFTFFPKDHYLRTALEKWFSENNRDDFGQGYLICTIGEK